MPTAIGPAACRYVVEPVASVRITLDAGCGENVWNLIPRFRSYAFVTVSSLFTQLQFLAALESFN